MNIIKYLTNIWTWRPKDIVGKVECMNVEKNEGIVDEVVYFPHKEVIKEDRLTTKLRIVFDASAKYKGTSSLSEVLHKGPCFNSDLYSLLLKFRIYSIAITAGIEK